MSLFYINTTAKSDRLLGIPWVVLHSDQQTYYVYRESGDLRRVAGVVLIVPPYFVPFFTTKEEGDAIHCLALVFDKTGLLQGYKTASGNESALLGMLTPLGGVEGPTIGKEQTSCLRALWNAGELQAFEHISPSEEMISQGIELKLPHYSAGETHIAGLTQNELLIKASRGDAEAQLQLYWEPTQPRRLTWLCRAADQGHPDAQYRLGVLYRYGSEEVQKDTKLAYMWFRLAELNKHDTATNDAQTTLEELTAGQALEAELQLKQWQPGQCERDLGITDHDQ